MMVPEPRSAAPIISYIIYYIYIIVHLVSFLTIAVQLLTEILVPKMLTAAALQSAHHMILRSQGCNSYAHQDCLTQPQSAQTLLNR